nr:MAG TPA: Cytosine specific methyltransferase [Caudoviricetes sp.]
MKQLTFLDLCSGISGFRLGLELAGHKCVGFCEYNKFAVTSYRAMHNTEGEWYADDITKLKAEDIPYADIWCFGFPCQDISIAGKQQGLSGTRSGIYHNIIALIKGKKEDDKPTYLFIENVKNLLSVNGGFDFATVLIEMDAAGYDCSWQVLNSKDFGVPQNRERVFIVGNLRARGAGEILPVNPEDGGALKQIIGGMQGYRVYDPVGISATLGANGGGMGAKTGLYFIDKCSTKVKLTGDARCLKARYHAGIVKHPAENSGVLETHAVITPDRIEKRQNGRRMKADGEPMFTLTGQDRHGVYQCSREIEKDMPLPLKINNATRKGYDTALPGDSISLAYPKSSTRRGRVGKGCAQTLETSCNIGTVTRYGRIRRLTPRECFRLQGFPDTLFDRAAAVCSESQLYKQAGNAVTVNVAFAVALALTESLLEE